MSGQPSAAEDVGAGGLWTRISRRLSLPGGK